MQNWDTESSNDTPDISIQINNCRKTEDIFNILQSENNLRLVKEDPSAFISTLRHVIFTYLINRERQYPFRTWMQKDVFQLYDQLRICPAEVNQVWQPLLSHGTFQKLYTTIPEVVDSLTPNKSLELLTLLKFIQPHNTDPLMRKCHIRALNGLSQADYSMIRSYLNVTSVSNDPRVARILLARFNREFEGDVAVGSALHQRIALLEVATHVKHLFSTDLLDRFVDKTTQVYSENNISDVDLLVRIGVVISTLFESPRCHDDSRVALEKCLIDFTSAACYRMENLSSLQFDAIERLTTKVIPYTITRSYIFR